MAGEWNKLKNKLENVNKLQASIFVCPEVISNDYLKDITQTTKQNIQVCLSS